MTNTSTSTVPGIIKVPFHGSSLFVVEHNGEPYTPMKVIVEGMGLDWKSQYVKVKQRFNTCVVEITMQLPNDSQRRPVTCLPIKKLPGWLHSINIGKIRPALRDRVAAYQAECDDALWQYWNEGVAINPRVGFSVNPDDVLTGEQQETLRLMVKTFVDRLPKEQQGPAATRAWSKLKSHFKVAYRQIPRSEFTEAVSIVTRTAAEWQVVEGAPILAAELGAKSHRELALGVLESTRWMFTVQNGRSVMVPLENDEFVVRPETFACAIQHSKCLSIQSLLEILAAVTGRIGRHESFRQPIERATAH
ncbi:phage antirepressor N-terminal domain-containing protein [Burkholderia stabilis]|uniref:phage antirepressor N-terminal domain-containing protein n=1 Tax=Burkholderia stabilis TaxID=95485 RepID=UPI001F4AF33F|nr:phage antirepressor N-terminal domain-containing protein [Burkholderia stabilis]